jgi:DNA-directed RNA polymerase specialized sigma24 family protein
VNPEEVAQLAGQLYPRWYSSLVRYAARVTGSLELAQDLVQESFLLLAQELLAGRAIHSPKGWTLRVVRHQISRQLREVKDRGIVFCSIDTDWGESIPELRTWQQEPQGRPRAVSRRN